MTADEKIKLLIGELTIQVIVLRDENERLKAQLAQSNMPATTVAEPGKPA